ncbi:MAG: hypothetical protein DYG96_05850 [Chlorobi bacterium CHB2]|nr:hypothetical protein [Chlorobi bacterium CHB2]
MDALLHAISRFPNGASIEELLSLPQFAFSRRTLQRRLRQLVQQHLVVADGRARAIRYRQADTPFQPSQAPATDTDMGGESALRSVPEPDRLRFAEVVHRELHSLHAGNIARYRLRPSEYEAWREVWE